MLNISAFVGLDGTPDDEYACTGIGLSQLARLQLQVLNANDMQDIELFSKAGQVALQDIQQAQVHRAKEKTMDELSNIMERIRFTLEDLKAGEKALTPDDYDRKRKIEEERMRRKLRKRKRKLLIKKRLKRRAERKAKGNVKNKESSLHGKIKEVGESEDEDKAKEIERIAEAQGLATQIAEGDQEVDATAMDRMAGATGLESQTAEKGKEDHAKAVDTISGATGLESQTAEEAKEEQARAMDTITGAKGPESQTAEVAKEDHAEAMDTISGATGLESQTAEEAKEEQAKAMDTIAHEKGPESQIAEGAKEDIEPRDDLALSEEDLGDDFSLGSGDLDDYSWSSLSDDSFTSSDENEDDEMKYDKLLKELEAPSRPSSVTQKVICIITKCICF
jgi:hypothetical protein